MLVYCSRSFMSFRLVVSVSCSNRHNKHSFASFLGYTWCDGCWEVRDKAPVSKRQSISSGVCQWCVNCNSCCQFPSICGMFSSEKQRFASTETYSYWRIPHPPTHTRPHLRTRGCLRLSWGLLSMFLNKSKHVLCSCPLFRTLSYCSLIAEIFLRFCALVSMSLCCQDTVDRMSTRNSRLRASNLLFCNVWSVLPS